MVRNMLRAKIHRATVTEANLNYMGSLTIDEELLRLADIRPYEKVLVVDIDNGSRLETYAIAGEAGSGVICMNGAAARLVQVGDKVIIMAFGGVAEGELDGWQPTIIFVDGDNKPLPAGDSPG